MYFSESVVAMAYGVPAMFTRTLLTMCLFPFYPFPPGTRAVYSCFSRDSGTVSGNVFPFRHALGELPGTFLAELPPPVARLPRILSLL